MPKFLFTETPSVTKAANKKGSKRASKIHTRELRIFLCRRCLRSWMRMARKLLSTLNEYFASFTIHSHQIYSTIAERISAGKQF